MNFKPELIDILLTNEQYPLTHLDLQDYSLWSTDGYFRNPLMFTFCFNNSKNLSFNDSQLHYLLHNADLKQHSKSGYNALMYYFINKKKENLYLAPNDVAYLVNSSDISHEDKYGWNALMYAFEMNIGHNLKLSSNIWKVLLNGVFNKKTQPHIIEKTLSYAAENLSKLYECSMGPSEIYNLIEDKKLYLKKLTNCIQKDKIYLQLMTNK